MYQNVEAQSIVETAWATYAARRLEKANFLEAEAGAQRSAGTRHLAAPLAICAGSGAMNISLRRTGVSILGEIPWGSHLCMFYESRDDLFDAVIPYLQAGLESNEFCRWVLAPEVTQAEASVALGLRIPDFNRYFASGKIELALAHEWYLGEGHFDVERITAGWNEKLRAALAKGYDGVRTSGTAFWLHAQHWKNFCDYEHLLNKMFEGKQITALCTFPIAASSAADILEVARAHQFAVIRRSGNWEFIEPPQATATDHSLTPREREVLWWAGEGKSAQEIGQILNIAKRTVDEHTQKAIRKLGVGNRTQTVATALRQRLIGRSPP